MSDTGFLAALGAGLLSFLSPCVLPLIPGYLSFISGQGATALGGREGRLRLFTRTLAFVLGFTLVFVALGMVFAGAGFLLGGLSHAFTVAAGVVVILLGLNIIFDFAKALNLEARFHARLPPRGYAGALLMGIAFAAGWSPCVGPILASIILLAAREGNSLRAALLLGVYSLGLALPFLAVALFFDATKPLMAALKRHMKAIRVVSGSFLILLGAGMALGKLGQVSSLAFAAGQSIKESLAISPLPARNVAVVVWLVLLLATLLPPLLRREGPRIPRIAFALLFLALACGELAGLWSSAAVISDWLLFKGA